MEKTGFPTVRITPESTKCLGTAPGRIEARDVSRQKLWLSDRELSNGELAENHDFVPSDDKMRNGESIRDGNSRNPLGG